MSERIPATRARRSEVERVVATVLELAIGTPLISAAALCGSWSTATRAGMASDVDVILLTDARPQLLRDERWATERFGDDTPVVRRQDWGPFVSEIRLRLPTGLEVELNVTDTRWAKTDPIDPGTRRVVADGFRVLHDPAGVLTALHGAVTRT